MVRRVAPTILFLAALACGRPDGADPVAAAAEALVTAFPTGSYVIPMDTTFQASGTLRAFGLVHALLRGGVPVHWAILAGKTFDFPTSTTAPNDFTVSAPATIANVETAAAIAVPVSYRGGAFIVSGADRAAATPIITAWLASDTVTVVHDVTGTFSADIARTLTSAPRIAVFADGNEDIAFTDLNAAGIRDSRGAMWSATSVDLLTDVGIAGPTTTSHTDGALFRADGSPAYCHVTSMHWEPGGAGVARVPEIVSEVRAWLDSSRAVHAFMECHAMATFENDSNGRFLTTTGIRTDEPAVGTPLTVSLADSPFNQFDGPLAPDGGSVRSIAPLAGGAFRPFTRTLIAGSGGVMWATARLDGDANNGQLTYLGGHDYSVAVPISTANNQTNGVRLILDSLFESDCASAAGSPLITVTASAPATSASRTFTITLTYTNTGGGHADSAVLRATLPAGATLGPTTGGGVLMGTDVVWTLGNIAPGASGTVTYTITVPADGTYDNSGRMAFNSSLTPRTANSNIATTIVGGVPDTMIVTSEPSPTTDRTGDFVFASTDPAATFECSIDGAAFTACPATFSTASLPDGMHTIAVRAVGAGGIDPTPATYTWLVDGTAPDTVIATAEPNPTNDPTGDFVFTSPESPVTFECSVDGGAFAACPASFSTAALADGMHTLAVRATDGAGNVDPTPATYTWVVDTMAPDTMIVTSEPDPTTDPTGDFVFASTEPGSTFECSIDGGAFMACPATFSTPALGDGMHTIAVRAIDPAGNVDPTPATYTWTVSTGTFVTIDMPADGSTTMDSTPTISGTGEPGAMVVVTVDGTVVGMTTVAADGTWSVPVATPLTEGPHTAVATSTNGAGVMATDTSTFTVDAGTVVDLRQPVDGSTVGTPRPELSGTSEPGNTVAITVDGTLVGTVTTDAEGNWSLVVPSDLADGTHNVSVLAMDATGHTATDTGSFIVAAAGPMVEIRTPVDGSTTTDPTPTLAGISDPGALVRVTVDGVVVGTVMADATGFWSIDVGSPLANGPHTVVAEVTDGAGRTATDSHDFTVDAAAPEIAIVAPADGSSTSDTTPTISGTATPGASIQVFVDGNLVGTATAAPDGSWSVTPTAALAGGPHAVRAIASNASGTATDGGVFFVDTSTFVTIDVPADGATIGTPRPTLLGTSEPGAIVEITIDGIVVGTVTAASDGSWSFRVPSDLAPGPHTASVVATDEAGNTATDMSTFTFDPTMLDTDGDGLLDTEECPLMPCPDTDGDGNPDFDDPDDDGDGIPTANEAPGGMHRDTDGDGRPDHLDPDDDGDGVPTMDEAPGGTPRDTDGDGMFDHLDTDDDNDTIPTMEEAPGGVGRDTDGDGRFDHIDPDDDDDTIPTARERADGMMHGNDVDGDGMPNWLDTNADGVMADDEVEGTGDADGDGVPDYLDPDEAPDAGMRDAGPRDGGAGDGGRSDGGGGIDAGPAGPGLAGGACGCTVPRRTRSEGALWALAALGLALAARRR